MRFPSADHTAMCLGPGSGRQPGRQALTSRLGVTRVAPSRLPQLHQGLGNPLILADIHGLSRTAEGEHGSPVAAHRVLTLGGARGDLR